MTDAKDTRRVRAARLSREARAEQLQAAALRVLAENGIGHTNHSLVAAAAGVSVPTVFFYYRTHAELTCLVLDNVAAQILNEIVRPGADRADPAEAIEWMLLRFAAFIDEDRDAARVWLDWSTAIRSETWPRYLTFLSTARQLIAGMIQGNVELADVIIGLAHMTGHMKFTHVSDDVVARTIHRLVDGYLASSPDA